MDTLGTFKYYVQFYIEKYIEYKDASSSKNAPLLQIPIKNALDQKEEYGNLW